MVDSAAAPKGQEGVGEAEEVEDYMSAAFVEETSPPPSATSLKRKREASESQKKPLKVLEKEKRQEGLATAIASDNKGFKMLRMMGYREGTPLGKAAQEGLKEPIPISLRGDRSGLGRLEEIQRVTAGQVKRKQESKQQLASSFKGRMRERFGERKVHGQLKKAFSICVQLDQDKGVADSPHLQHFEAEEKRKLEEGEAYEPVMWEARFWLPSGSTRHALTHVCALIQYEETVERLTSVLDHLRTKHLYCFFCGCTFNDTEDLEQNCPGLSEADHE